MLIVIVSPPTIVLESFEILLILSFRDDTLDDKELLVCELLRILAPRGKLAIAGEFTKKELLFISTSSAPLSARVVSPPPK